MDDVRADPSQKLHITADNAEAFFATDEPGVQRFLRAVPGTGEALGLNDSWAFDAISQVGNYGGIFDRHLGPGTPLDLTRGINAQWTQGGLISAPPIR